MKQTNNIELTKKEVLRASLIMRNPLKELLTNLSKVETNLKELKKSKVYTEAEYNEAYNLIIELTDSVIFVK